MDLRSYIHEAKKQLDDMESMWRENNKKNPKDWPLNMAEEEWIDQEEAIRFS